MKKYDPLKAPDNAQWLALDEQTRIDLVQKYHRQKKVDLPNAQLHAIIHAVVENQLAVNDPPAVRAALERLMGPDQLDRHEAMHAIGTVLMFHMNALLSPEGLTEKELKDYERNLEQLDKQTWYEMTEGEEDLGDDDPDFGDPDDLEFEEELTPELMKEMLKLIKENPDILRLAEEELARDEKAGNKQKKEKKKKPAAKVIPLNSETDEMMEFKINLLEVDLPVWRQIQVPANYTFYDLHVAIQDAMGWFDNHLHAFRFEKGEVEVAAPIGIPDPANLGDPDFLPGWEHPLAERFKKPGDKAIYEYDFGDGWEHEVVLEKILKKEAGAEYPRCTDGAGACPLEDCGGPWGYQDMLEALKKPKSKRAQEIFEWLGDDQFDPEAFNAREVFFTDPEVRLETLKDDMGLE